MKENVFFIKYIKYKIIYILFLHLKKKVNPRRCKLKLRQVFLTKLCAILNISGTPVQLVQCSNHYINSINYINSSQNFFSPAILASRNAE